MIRKTLLFVSIILIAFQCYNPVRLIERESHFNTIPNPVLYEQEVQFNFNVIIPPLTKRPRFDSIHYQLLTIDLNGDSILLGKSSQIIYDSIDFKSPLTLNNSISKPIDDLGDTSEIIIKRSIHSKDRFIELMEFEIGKIIKTKGNN
jgi:hypothetical protein